MKALLIRHGQTDLNLEGTVFSRRDPPLNLVGNTQVHLLADWLKDYPVRMVVSSPLQRALQTAQIIALDHSVEIRTERDLMELDCGEAEGLTPEELETRIPGFVQQWRSSAGTTRWPGGETLLETARRVIGVLRRYAEEFKDQTVCFVGHGIAFKAALARLLGIGVDNFRVLSMDEASVTVLEISGEDVRLELLNLAPWRR